MLLRRMLAALGLLLFLAVLVLGPATLYADTVYRNVFGKDAMQSAEETAYVTSFDLFAEETEHQTQSRVSGWLSTVTSKEAVISSRGAKLYATQYEPIGSAANAPWAIVFHGGMGTERSQVLDVACMLSVRGYRVLTPDLYAHGLSEGAASTLGFGDAQDVRAWIDYAEKERPDAPIVLFGQDEGAAAVLTAASEGVSDSVAAVAADSAYDDGEAYMLSAAGLQEDGLNAALLKLMFRHQTGQNMTKLSDRIGGAEMPLLLIHGTGDQLVPAWNSEDIASAAAGNAQLLYIEGAGHGLARYVQEKTYYDALLGFYEAALKR